MVKTATYQDFAGRQWRTLLPDDAPDSEAPNGIPAGPPSLEELGLPTHIEVRLQNELHARGLFTLEDTQGRRAELEASLRAALRLDVERLHAVYAANI